MIAKHLRCAFGMFTCFGMIVPSIAIAAVSSGAKATESTTVTKNLVTKNLDTKHLVQMPRDVALYVGGTLKGQLLDAQGRAVVGAPVAVQSAGKEVARVQTDKEGKFSVAGLRGGVHLVTTDGQQSVCRLWAPRTAPPAAQRGLMLVNSTDVVRGQCGCGTPVCGTPVRGGGCSKNYGFGGGGIGNWIADHPILSAGAVAAAIAVPIALDDNDAPASP